MKSKKQQETKYRLLVGVREPQAVSMKLGFTKIAEILEAAASVLGYHDLKGSGDLDITNASNLGTDLYKAGKIVREMKNSLLGSLPRRDRKPKRSLPTQDATNEEDASGQGEGGGDEEDVVSDEDVVGVVGDEEDVVSETSDEGEGDDSVEIGVRASSPEV